MCEGAQYRCTGLQEFPARSIKRPDHSRQDQDQKKLLPQRPFLPRHRHELADLLDRPSPDDFDETEDRRNPVVQEFQELIKNLFHIQDPRRSTGLYEQTQSKRKEAALGSQSQANRLNHFKRLSAVSSDAV